MYAVLTTLYGDNPQITDWLGIGDTLTSLSGVALASVTQAAVFGWAFFQLRDGALDDLEEVVRTAGHREPEAEAAWEEGGTGPMAPIDEPPPQMVEGLGQAGLSAGQIGMATQAWRVLHDAGIASAVVKREFEDRVTYGKVG